MKITNEQAVLELEQQVQLIISYWKLYHLHRRGKEQRRHTDTEDFFSPSLEQIMSQYNSWYDKCYACISQIHPDSLSEFQKFQHEIEDCFNKPFMSGHDERFIELFEKQLRSARRIVSQIPMQYPKIITQEGKMQKVINFFYAISLMVSITFNILQVAYFKR